MTIQHQSKRSFSTGTPHRPTLIEADFDDFVTTVVRNDGQDHDHQDDGDHHLPLKKRARLTLLEAAASSSSCPNKETKSIETMTETTAKATATNCSGNKKMDILLQAIEEVQSSSSSPSPCDGRRENDVVLVDRIPPIVHHHHRHHGQTNSVTTSSTTSVAGSTSSSSMASSLPSPQMMSRLIRQASQVAAAAAFCQGSKRNTRAVSTRLPPLTQCTPLGAPPALPTFLRPGQVMVRNGPQTTALPMKSNQDENIITFPPRKLGELSSQLQ